jgi:HSP20 family protein
MTLTRWQRPDFWNLHPLRRMTNLRDEVDNLFNLAFGRLADSNVENRRESQLLEGWFPAVDVYEDKDALLVKAELPGLKKEDIEISLQEGFLILSGERKQEEKQEGAELYRSERWVGRFQRSINLPCKVEAEKIKATYNEGVLAVTLPKAEEAKPKQIQVSFK